MAKNITLLNRFHNTKSWFVFHVAGCLLTWILADTIWVPYLRMTLGTQCQQGQKWLKKWRLSKTILFRAARTYLVHIREYPPHPPQTKLTTNFTKLASTEIVMPSFHLIPHPTILSNIWFQYFSSLKCFWWTKKCCQTENVRWSLPIYIKARFA